MLGMHGAVNCRLVDEVWGYVSLVSSLGCSDPLYFSSGFGNSKIGGLSAG